MSEKATEQSKELTVKFKVGECDITLTPSIVQKYIVGTDSKITIQEFKFFTELCKARQLNPFLKEAYCVKYGEEPAQIVIAKEVFVNRAIIHPDYDGKETGVIVLDKDGKMIERPGCVVLPDEKLVGGWARVYRKNWNHPEYMSVSFDEVAGRKKDGRLNYNWDKKGATMVEKVAKVRALREAFTDEFHGLNDYGSGASVVIEDYESEPETVEAEIVESAPKAEKKSKTVSMDEL